MNKAIDTTASAVRAMTKIPQSVYDLEEPLAALNRATIILDEYANFEFRSSFNASPDAMFPFTLTGDQKHGITYMINHVRERVYDLEAAFNKALNAEVSS